jgi:YesN/AraC family two-component response regulator
LFSLLIMGLQIRIIVRNWHFDQKDKHDRNQPLFWFIFILTSMYLLMLIPGFFGVLFNSSWYSLQFLNVNLAISLLAVALFILFSPGILYGFYPLPQMAKGEITEVAIPASSVAESIEADTTSTLPETPVLFLKEKELSDIIQKIESYMTNNRPYLNHRYSIHDLARDIEIPVYQLSPVINGHFGSNFSSWVNKFRVDHFIEICKMEDNKDLTFDALSSESGFSNRVSFIKAFKKEKGTTPGIYVSEQIKQH